ncbi:MAG: hypothetical protein H7Y17_03445 [Chlorobia bacterium]|nr:hypothetical protein [Fimbriimonadaceae bacterium]
MSQVEAAEPKRVRKGCWIVFGILGTMFLAVALFYGPAVCDFIGVYGLDALSKPEKHAYSATSEKNLKAIYQGMMLYHESEGQFPDASGWMDAIENRLQSNDLAKGEGAKKLIRPDLGGNPGEFGYAMNDAASAKYKDDVKDPSNTPLVFESKATSRNEHGDPEKSRSGLAITVDGKILKGP